MDMTESATHTMVRESVRRHIDAAHAAGVDVLDLYRSEYDARLRQMLDRGYDFGQGVEWVNAAALSLAAYEYGECPNDLFAQAAWLALGLECAYSYGETCHYNGDQSPL